MKKYLQTGLFLLMAMALIFGGRVIVNAATLPADISVNSYGVYSDASSTTPLSKVEEGLTYCIKFTVLNYTESSLSDVTLSVANLGGFSEVSAASDFDIAASSSTEVPVYVDFDGSSKYLTLTLSYSVGADTYTRTQKISISEAVVKETTTPTDDTSDDFDPVVPTPKLSVMSRDVSVTAGQSSTISFSLNNISGNTAKSITAMLQPGSGIEDIFADAGDSSYKYSLNTLSAGKSQTVNFTFTPLASLKGGAYPMTLNLTYRNTSGTTYTDSYDFSLKVDSNTMPIDLQVASVKVLGSTGQVVAGKAFDLQVNVKNAGSVTAKSVKVSFDDLSKETFFRTGEYGDLSLGSIAGGATGSGSVHLTSSESLDNGFAPLSVTIKYLDAGEEKTVAAKVFVPVGGGEGGEGVVPRIILSQYHMDRPTVNAGEVFDFYFSLQNTSLSKTVNNLKISVGSEDGVIIPNSGSNSFFVRSIQPGKDSSFQLALSVKGDAETKSYPLTFTIEYEDNKGQQLTSSETISIPVNQPQNLVFQNQNYPTAGNVGTPASLSLDYINKGKGTLYNLTVSIEGDVTAEEGGSIYIGNLTSGSMDYLETTITPNTVGEIPCKVVFTFEDAAGEETRIEEPFTMTVAEAMPEAPVTGEMPGDMPPAQAGVNPLIWIVLAVVVVVVVAAILLIKRKRKKARLAREAADAEDVDIDI